MAGVSDRTHFRPNTRDPLAEKLIGPGKPFELETVEVQGHRHDLFKGAARNLAQLYRQGMAFGAREMIVEGDRVVTYDEAFAQAGALADALRHDFGVEKGTTVAIATANRAEWIIALLAVTSLGAVAVAVNSRGVAEEMLRAMDLVDTAVAILDAERADTIAAERPDPEWPRIVIGEPRSGLRSGKDADFAALAEPRADAPFEPVEMDPAAGGIVLFTSGTTGFPKAALLSQGAVANSVALSVFMGALQDRRYEEENGETLPAEALSMATPLILLGPMFHLSGIMPVMRAVSVGTTIHIMGKWNADLAFDMIENVGMTRLSFVPAMLWDMLRSPRATPEMLGKVRYMMNGAAPLDAELVDEIGRRMPQCLIATTYGQTEVTSFTASNSGQTYIDNPDTVGWACPSVNVAILRDDGSEADIGEAGEIWVSSPLLMSEYVNNRKATAQTLQNGWLASGDIGRFDENGLLTIVDRKKNMIISGGENVYCAEVERVLASHQAVREAIAYGRPDARMGERVEATVFASQADVSEAALTEHCKAHMASYKVPRTIAFRSSALPRTASGKVDRGAFLKSLSD